MAVILHSIYGSRLGISADGVLVLDGVAATYGTNLGNGTAGSPSSSFASDTDTGMYHKAANNIGWAVNGALGMDLSTTALTLATGTDLVFSGTTGQCLVQFPDNLASGLVIGEGANAYLTFVSTDSSESALFSKPLRVLSTNAITAHAGGGQGSATALTSDINSITVCATAGDSVVLPASTAGKRVQVSNLGATYANVFPASGDLIDALAANAGVSLPVGASITFTCSVAGSWKASPVARPASKFTTAADVTTFVAGDLSGAATVVHHNTQGTPGSVAFRTAAQMFADDPYARVGDSYLLRIVNAQGTGTLTVTGAATGITLTGTATIAANTFRDFVVTYTSASALVIQNAAVGTFS